MANRCGPIGLMLMLQVVLAVCLTLLPVAAVSAEGPQGGGRVCLNEGEGDDDAEVAAPASRFCPPIPV